MICHELWDYDDALRTATLTGFAVLCRECNLVHHAGRAGAHDLGELALTHMMAVNGIGYEEAINVLRDAMAEWKQRSANAWTVVIAEGILTQYPQLAVLHGTAAAPGDGSKRLAERSR